MSDLYFTLAIPKPITQQDLKTELWPLSEKWKELGPSRRDETNSIDCLGLNITYANTLYGENPHPDKWGGFLELRVDRGKNNFYNVIFSFQIVLCMGEKWPSAVFVGFQDIFQVSFYYRRGLLTLNSAADGIILWPIDQLSKICDIRTKRIQKIAENNMPIRTVYPTFDD